MIDKVLEASAINNRAITIVYAADNTLTKRNIRVLEIREKEIQVYCYLRKQIRTFKKDNILAAEYAKSYRRGG
jgi:predicted DNA-binding transcriptional regulator YafY